MGPVAPPINLPPTASRVLISGTPQVGQVLTGSFIYADAENDPQGASTFRWLRGTTPIDGATASTYTLVAADQEATVSFEVTPVAQTGTSPGLAVTSATVGPVAAALDDPPVASGVRITGTPPGRPGADGQLHLQRYRGAIRRASPPSAGCAVPPPSPEPRPGAIPWSPPIKGPR